MKTLQKSPKRTFDQIDWAGTGDFLVVVEPLAKGEGGLAMLREVVAGRAARGGQTVSPGARSAQFCLDHDVLVGFFCRHGCLSFAVF